MAAHHTLGLQLLFLGLLHAHGILDEGHHVSHAQNALGHAVGVEHLQGIGLLARGDELNGLAGHLAHGQGAAAAGVAVHLRHDDAVEVHSAGEGLHDVHHVLAGHGVHHHEDLVGLHGLLDGLGLGHHVVVHVQAAGRVDDDHVAQVVDGVLDALPGNGHGILAVAAVHAHADLVAQGLQLVGGGGAVHVAGDEQRGMALLLQAVGQLGRGRGLAGALQAHEHDDVGNAAAQHEPRIGAAQKLGQLVQHDLHDVLGRRERIEHLRCQTALLRLCDEVLHHLEIDIRLQKSKTDLTHCLIDIFFSKPTLRAQT